MAVLSQYAFLQALGWATLNSFWQMALLWCIYCAANYVLNLSSFQKYSFAVAAMGGSFVWFFFSFFKFYVNPSYYNFSFSAGIFSSYFINQIITTASVVYLCLLIVPSYRLFKGWRHIQQLKKQKLHKADWRYRLFVQKIADQLGIRKPVHVYISEMAKSPLTIGYIKPVILLPFAALNNLSISQVEAILLHELSHIRRHDYLVNLAVTVIHTLLYFNPFAHTFIHILEEEREKCCDAMVLQFSYDKISYASALLMLERYAQTLILAAAGKKHLLHRIEKIIGIEKKPKFKLQQAFGIFIVLFSVLLINAVLLAGRQYPSTYSKTALTTFVTPFYFDPGVFTSAETEQVKPQKVMSLAILSDREGNKNNISVKKITKNTTKPSQPVIGDLPLHIDPPINNIIPVVFKTANAPLKNLQEDQVERTVEAARKVLTTLEWKEIENSIADGMTNAEKEMARHQYISKIEKLNWKNIEDHLKASYDRMNWPKINIKLDSALIIIKLDSLQKVYTDIISETEKVKNKANINCPLACPDVSAEQLQKLKEATQKNLYRIKAMRTKKIIHI